MQNQNQYICIQKSDTSCLETLMPAMGYVPWQTFEGAFSLCHALQVGTIFPILEKPFCGKGGRCR